jgi:tRNA-specific 2-thiouridylase
MAREINLPTAEKKDSQGLCFIGKVKLPVFLQQQLAPKEGNIIYVTPTDFLTVGSHLSKTQGVWSDDDRKWAAQDVNWSDIKGIWVGKHQGAHYYTVGQRKGLGIGGFKEPLFILATDTKTNTVYVGEGENHPGLFRSVIFIPESEQSWLQSKIQFFQDKKSCQMEVRIRYRQPLETAVIFQEQDGIYIEFDQPQRAVARGQFAAWYRNNELIGSGKMIL